MPTNKVIPIKYDQLAGLSLDQLVKAANRHIDWARGEGRFRGNPRISLSPGWLNEIGVRNNDETAFNYGEFDDYLILFNSKKIEVFRVTVDPARMGNMRGHLRNGAWNSYHIRHHKWMSMKFDYWDGKVRKRWAICQDKDKVEVARTDGHGKLIKYESGFFGINQHDPKRTGLDTSIACTVVQKMETYCRDFVPMLVTDADLNGKPVQFVPTNPKDITYNLNSADRWRSFL